ncbi:hypothetical protein L6452_16960 [Arctium lappa]|uniref:Uncharacterized protein n=1 Tax=Arctium lappa TaxID=4217 RepID=A0ACB9C1Y6_ARCLA|nr:hypothetical protein L6452_16960 [Arctium lappa]
MDTPRNSDYFAQELAVSGTADESAYMLADCWNTLDENSCTECLESAFASILQCLPSSEGRVLYTGCFMRIAGTLYADFGLARSFQQDKNHISIGIAGTLAVRFSLRQSSKMVNPPDPTSNLSTESQAEIRDEETFNEVRAGRVEEVFDQNMMLSDDNMKKKVEKVVHIGLLCTQEVPSLRPTMSMALQMLSKNIHPLPLPSNLAFLPTFLPKSNGQPNEVGSDQAFRLGITNPTSVPKVSFTSLGPR